MISNVTRYLVHRVLSRRVAVRSFAGSLVVWLNLAITMQADEPIDFNRHIRPILRQHCTACHGGVKAASGISFVYRESALAEGESGARAIVAGKPQESELIRRIEANDDERMPPADHGPALSPEEKSLLKKWIASGATWSELWSLQAVAKPTPPTCQKVDWCESPLDAYVLHALEQQHLQPSHAAGPAEWLRRVSLDLIGLPPSLEQYQSFAANFQRDPRQAKSDVVDSLLKSPQFGERWATMWLDLARYSDTYGYEKDPTRTIWPWRDWVVRAFNDDMPYDQFTLKQIAGDLLPQATADDLLATAFHRNTQNNSEGGTDDEEFRTAAVIDRVNTIWTTWHATTFGCVRCHAHPYDPYPHQDYYRFASFFNNAEDCDQNDDFPWLKFDASQPEVTFQLQTKIRELKSQIHHASRKVVDAVDDWTTLRGSSPSTTGGSLTCDETGLFHATGTLPTGVRYQFQFEAVEGIQAFRLHLLPDSDLPNQPPERGQVLSEIKANLIDAEDKKNPVTFQRAIADYEAGPFEASDSLAPGGPGFGSYPVMHSSRWCVFVLEKPIPAETKAIEFQLIQSQASNSGFQACTLRRFRWEGSRSTHFDAIRKDSVIATWSQDIKTHQEDLQKRKPLQVPVLIERALPATRDTHVHLRGNRTTLGERVTPGIPTPLSHIATSEITDRIALANWMCHEKHPLTSRTMVNRIWSEFFGTGIVETLEDMGTTGADPSHPELLDYLAWKFMKDHRWSLKALMREIVLSSTYGQTSRTNYIVVAEDPYNRRLGRGPRTRMTAEMIRDHALFLSGLLSSKIGGPPVYPPQPEGIWSSVYSGEKWKTSTGEDRYRRALYTFQKRTSGYPGLLAFDAPTRESCSARRIPTNTPLQALLTLNDPAFVEIAQAFAKKMQASSSSVADQIRMGCQQITLEPPSEHLVQRLVQLHSEICSELQETSPTDWKHPLGANPDEVAMVMVANSIFNLDAFLVR